MCRCGLLIVSLILTGCSSSSLVVIEHGELAERAQLGVPFYPQEEFHCGPAALAGLFAFNDAERSPDEIAAWVYIPDRKGSLQPEMRSAIRRAGFLAYQLGPEIERLLQEVAAGNPVLVLQNLGPAWWPKWHYATVVGYDLSKQKIILNSGRIEGYELGFRSFSATWERAGSWALLVLPPDQLPQTASPENFLEAAVELESVGQQDAAYMAYKTALARWPGEGIALMGLGNIYLAQGEFKKSVRAFTALVEQQPDNALAWNNLAYAYRAYGCPAESLASISMAASLAPDDERVADSYAELNEVRSTKAAENCRAVALQQ